MAMSAADLVGSWPVDPDDVIVPESPDHRIMTELVAAVAGRQLAGHVCYRDMNWYPLDGEGPMAPDVMVLAAGQLPARAKSYQRLGVVAYTVGITPPCAVTRFAPGDVDPISWLGRPMVELGGLIIERADDDARLIVRSPDGLDVSSDTELWQLLDARAEEAAAQAEAAASRVAALEAQLRQLGVEPQV